MGSERTFEQDTTNVDEMERILLRMTEALAFDLRRKEKMTSCVTVKIRYSNFDTHTLQKRIPYTSFDHVLKKEVKGLFKQLYNRRMLIRLIGVRLSHLITGSYQMNLFEDSSEMIRLYQSLDTIRKRYGKHAIHSASATIMATKAQRHEENTKILLKT